MTYYATFARPYQAHQAGDPIEVRPQMQHSLDAESDPQYAANRRPEVQPAFRPAPQRQFE